MRGYLNTLPKWRHVPDLPIDPASRLAPDRLTPPSSGVGDYGLAPNETPGHRLTADGPRRPAPTDLVPPGPVGAPSPADVLIQRGILTVTKDGRLVPTGDASAVAGHFGGQRTPPTDT